MRSYGDYITVDEKPDRGKLEEYVHLLVDQMLDVFDSTKLELNDYIIEFIVKPAYIQEGKYTVGWKATVKGLSGTVKR